MDPARVNETLQLSCFFEWVEDSSSAVSSRFKAEAGSAMVFLQSYESGIRGLLFWKPELTLLAFLVRTLPSSDLWHLRRPLKSCKTDSNPDPTKCPNRHNFGSVEIEAWGACCPSRLVLGSKARCSWSSRLSWSPWSCWSWSNTSGRIEPAWLALNLA